MSDDWTQVYYDYYYYLIKTLTETETQLKTRLLRKITSLKLNDDDLWLDRKNNKTHKRQNKGENREKCDVFFFCKIFDTQADRSSKSLRKLWKFSKAALLLRGRQCRWSITTMAPSRVSSSRCHTTLSWCIGAWLLAISNKNASPLLKEAVELRRRLCSPLEKIFYGGRDRTLTPLIINYVNEKPTDRRLILCSKKPN